VHVIALALSLVGISLGWVPGLGWLGFALAAAEVGVSVRGISDKRTGPAGLGYDTAANVIGGFGLPWILALQIKHAGGGLERLLIDWPLDRLLAAIAVAIVVFWAAQIVGRFKARALCVSLSLAAVLAFTAAGASAWTVADRAQMTVVQGSR
jgi:hypothetical protein